MKPKAVKEWESKFCILELPDEKFIFGMPQTFNKSYIILVDPTGQHHKVLYKEILNIKERIA